MVHEKDPSFLNMGVILTSFEDNPTSEVWLPFP